MRRSSFRHCGWLIAILCVATVAGDAAVGRAGPLAKRRAARHSWGRFQPGSWCLVRTVTETLDAQGQPSAQTIAETRTTIDEVNDGGVTLQIHKSVEVAGKKLEAPPQKVVALAASDSSSEANEELGSEELTISGRAYPCRVERTTTTAAGRTLSVRTWTNDEVPPYLLKRESVTTDVASSMKIEEETLDVLTLGTPRKLLGVTRPAAELRLVTRNAKGRTVTQAWQSLDVPGGIIGQNSEEFDAQDHLLRRSRLELVDFAVK